MDFRQLNAIVAISEHGSFSAAADALATVQSNVSTHVKKLEQELGMVLIDRASGELTEAGEIVVARARRVIHELDALSSDVTALHHEVVGTVRIGAIGTAARWIVPQLLDISPQRHPLLNLIFVEATATGIDAQLMNGQVDVGILVLPAAGTELRTIALFEEDIGLVVPRDHPLATAERVTMRDLVDLPLLLPTSNVAFRSELDEAAQQAGLTLHPRAEVDSLRLITSLTFERCGVALLPAGAVPAYIADEWALIPVEGLAPRLVGFAQRRRSLPGAAVRAVLEILSEIVFDQSRHPPGVRPIAPDEHRPEPFAPFASEAS